MNHHYHKILQSVFAHPISANIDYKDITHLFAEFGALMDEKSGNRLEVELKGHTFFLHRPHGHALPIDEVARVRDFLKQCDITPDTMAAA
jgi:hypothetical protein